MPYDRVENGGDGGVRWNLGIIALEPHLLCAIFDSSTFKMHDVRQIVLFFSTSVPAYERISM